MRSDRTSIAPSEPAVHHIRDGELAGWSLRVSPRGALEARGGAPDQSWLPAPLRLLTRHYAADSDVWAWLRAHGARRASPSGSNVPESARGRKVFTARLPPELISRIRETARRDGVDVETVLREGLDARERARRHSSS